MYLIPDQRQSKHHLGARFCQDPRIVPGRGTFKRLASAFEGLRPSAHGDENGGTTHEAAGQGVLIIPASQRFAQLIEASESLVQTALQEQTDTPVGLHEAKTEGDAPTAREVDSLVGEV